MSLLVCFDQRRILLEHFSMRKGFKVQWWWWVGGGGGGGGGAGRGERGTRVKRRREVYGRLEKKGTLVARFPSRSRVAGSGRKRKNYSTFPDILQSKKRKEAGVNKNRAETGV